MFNEVFYNDSITNDVYFEIVKKYFDKGNIDIYSSAYFDGNLFCYSNRGHDLYEAKKTSENF